VEGELELSELKKEFAKFLLETKAVKFGEFKLKSGRISPYFINIGEIIDGKSISKLGEFYAKAIVEYNIINEIDVLFGPSYKGIPIVVSTAIALNNMFGICKRFAFNRKEEKKYGEKGIIIGEIREGDRVLILDDVITTGETKEEILKIISSFNAKVCFIIIAVDRLERGKTNLTAIKEFEIKYGIPIRAIVTIEDIIKTALEMNYIREEDLEKIMKYLKEYGGK
jgi:orotate phosphoribosyltransferase